MWHRSGVDLDAFSAVRQPRWERLKTLSLARGRTGAEADEMTRLYRSTAADLSAVRSAAPEPSVITKLSLLLSRSRVWLTGEATFSPVQVRHYFFRTLPASLYVVRWWALCYGLAVIAMGIISAVYVLHTPGALDLIDTPEGRAEFANKSFASYYTDYDNTTFALGVWSNNAYLAFLCLVSGITGILPLVLAFNTALQLGTSAAMMSEHDGLDVFFQLIVPHGLLELSAVFLAAGAGLYMFWRLLVPPPGQTRAEGLSEAFRALVAALLGIAITLFISGLIEGYVTPSHVPWAVKDALGVLAVASFWLFIFVMGRRGHELGGADVEAQLRAERAATAA